MFDRVLLFFLFVIAPSLMAQDQCRLSLIGEVHDGETDLPIAFAIVKLSPLNKVLETDKNGEYSLTGLCKGQYQIEISFLGYKTYTQTIQLEKNLHLDVHLHQENCELESVSIIHERPSTYTFAKVRLDKEKLEAQKGKPLGELLETLAGVNSIKSGPTVFKPMIQGLYGNRLMIVHEGIRLEGQQWGNDHAPELSPEQAERIEVIKGAAALRYGNEALGGVVLVNTEKPLTSPGFEGEASSGFFSNGRGANGALKLNFSLEKVKGLGILAFINGKKHGNLNTPNYYLQNTGSHELNHAIDVQFHRKKFNLLIGCSNYYTQLGIFSGIQNANIIELTKALKRERPNTDNRFSYQIDRSYQGVRHQTYRLKLDGISTTWGRPSVLLAFQQNVRNEFDTHRPKGDRSDKATIGYDLGTFYSEASFEHKPIKQWTGVTGYSLMRQSNVSSTTNVRLFIPNFYSTTHSLFWIESYRWNRFLMELGTRGEWRDYQIFKYIGNELIKPSKNYLASSYSLGSSYFFTEKWLLKGNLSFINRAPAINEMFSDGLHHAEGIFINADANSTYRFENEKLTNFNLIMEHDSKLLKSNLTLFHHYFQRYIYLRPDGVVNSIRGAYPAFKYDQSQVIFWGIDARVHWKPLLKWDWESSFSYTYAQNHDTRDFFIGIPPARLSCRINYEVYNGQKIRINAYVTAIHTLKQANFPRNIEKFEYQDLVGIQEYVYEGDFLPAPSSYTLMECGTNMELTTSKKKPIQLYFSIENFTNERYRDYLNRLRYYADEKGRNIRVRIVVPF